MRPYQARSICNQQKSAHKKSFRSLCEGRNFTRKFPKKSNRWLEKKILERDQVQFIVASSQILEPRIESAA